MDFKVLIEDKNDIERFILIVNLGILEALKNDSISFEQARNYFLRPYIAQLLKEVKGRKKIIHLLEECCMLEDINKLVPNKFEEALTSNIQRTAELLKELPRLEDEKYWINGFDAD